MFALNRLILKLFKYHYGFHLVGKRISGKNLNSFNKYFLYGLRKSFFVMNFEEFIFNFRITLFFLIRLITLRGKILVVDSREFLRSCLIYFFIKSKHYYQIQKWIGGTLSNFKFFRSFYLFIYKKKMSFTKYFFFVNYFRGILAMKQLPNLIVCTNSEEQLTVLQESFRVGIPLCATITPFSINFGVTFPLIYNNNDKSTLVCFYQFLRNCIFLGLFKEIFFFYKNFFLRLKKIRKYFFFISNLTVKSQFDQFTELNENFFFNKTFFDFRHLLTLQNRKQLILNVLLKKLKTNIIKSLNLKIDISYLNDFTNFIFFEDLKNSKFFFQDHLKNKFYKKKPEFFPLFFNYSKIYISKYNTFSSFIRKILKKKNFFHLI